MLTFFQNALLQSTHTTAKVAEGGASGDFEKRLDSLINKKQKRAASPEPEPEMSPTDATLKPLSNMGTALVELSAIAEQLARIDLMISQVIDGAPECDDAKKWQEVSLNALRWSRETLCQKQMRYLADLGAVASPKPEQSDDSNVVQSDEADVEEPKWMGWCKADVEACPEFVPQATPAMSKTAVVAMAKADVEGGGSLRKDLELLRDHDPQCVFIVRKIKKLGFESPQFLEDHFVQFGEVKTVLVAHSHVKATSKRTNGRVRPAALGFVVMASQEGVQRALEAGLSQVVCGTVIELSPFDAFEDQ